MYYRETKGFLGIPQSESCYDDAKYVIVSVPYDSTTSYNGGTKKGPAAIIEASQQVELFDAETGIDASKRAVVHTLNEIEPDLSSPENMMKRVTSVCSDLLKDEKFLITLGGEHSITLGPVQAIKKSQKWKNFSVLQIDAHSDLRDTYEGTPFNHACIMRRIHDMGIPFTQVGIRSVSREEHEFISENRLSTSFFAWNLFENGFNPREICETLTEDVYVTIDVDGFDPSVFPGTGTPEPGGIGWYEFLKLFRQLVLCRNVIGFDIVETIPTYPFHRTEYAAAKLLYKMITYLEV